jgi:hypothetical protein
MRKQHPRKKRRAAPKAVLRLTDLDQAKSAVLNSLTCVDAQRGYRHAIDEFVERCAAWPTTRLIAALLSADLPAGIRRVKGVKKIGSR